jgi:hypothetical protein
MEDLMLERSRLNAATVAGLLFGPCLLLVAGCEPPPAPAAPAVSEELTTALTVINIPGASADSSCVHQVPDGATVSSDGTVKLDGKVVARFPACKVAVVPHKAPGKPVNTSRIEDDSAAAFPKGSCPAPHGTCAGFFDGLQDAWLVPAPPSRSGALVYLFNALASSDGVTTVNSVLQYGNNGLFGGDSWTVASWYITKNNVFHTPPVAVSPGDTVGGGLFGASCGTSGACSWMLAASGPAFPDLTVAVSRPLVTAYRGVLEAFHFDGCDQLPASPSTVFDFTIITEPDSSGKGQDEIEDVLAWTPAVTPGVTPSCGYQVTDDFFSATLNY